MAPSASKSSVDMPSAEKLRAVFNGRVIAPGDAHYDQARSTVWGDIDRRPAVIIRVKDATDVARVVSVARETGLPLAVRGGGHGLAGFGVTDGGIVLDLNEMKNMQIEEQGRTMWAEAGLTTGEVTAALDERGLAVGFGDTGSVGIGGLTLGGGMGYLVRKHGLTIDDLLAAEVVTADSRLLHADAQTHPDLFWAIRGGGGNFGVVTRFLYRLHEMGRVLGGLLVLPATPSVIEDFVGLAQAAPDELSIIVNITPAPPLPFLPSEAHGKLVMFATLVYAGDVEPGMQAVSPFKGLAKPLADQVRPLRYAEIFPKNSSNGSYRPMAALRTTFVDHVRHSEAEAILDYLGRSPGKVAVTQIRVLGGAMARVEAEATSFAHRKARIMLNVTTLYDRPEQKPDAEAWAGEFSHALRQGEPGAFVNFLGDEGGARVREAYPGPTWARLSAIKRRYDPGNLFRLNHNIPPAKEIEE